MRALFQRAAKQAPCIIFMDELDTLGKQRSLRLGACWICWDDCFLGGGGMDFFFKKN